MEIVKMKIMKIELENLHLPSPPSLQGLGVNDDLEGDNQEEKEDDFNNFNGLSSINDLDINILLQNVEKNFTDDSSHFHLDNLLHVPQELCYYKLTQNLVGDLNCTAVVTSWEFITHYADRRAVATCPNFVELFQFVDGLVGELRGVGKAVLNYCLWK